MSIRTRILLFALLATLLPAAGLGWVYFQQASQSLRQGAQQSLEDSALFLERQLQIWLRERLYDLRTFAGSYLLTEALAPAAMAEKPRAVRGYLDLVRRRAASQLSFQLFDPLGRPVARSPEHGPAWALPPDWRRQLEQNRRVVGALLQPAQEPRLLLAVPVRNPKGDVLGLLAAELSLDPLAALAEVPADGSLLLVDRRGRVLFAEGEANPLVRSPATTAALFDMAGQLVEHRGADDRRMLSVLRPVDGYPWGVVASLDGERLFAGMARMQEFTLLLVALLVAVIGFLAWRLAHHILTPLGHLIRAAQRVADGDLQVQVPLTHQDELGFASMIFNDMVAQLKHHHERLELLSTTDALTGLPNRKGLLAGFEAFLARYRRHHRPFSVVMLDIDHFKRVNDRYGHLTGDHVLHQVARILVREMRQVDLVGRFGGEEFMLLLDETPETSACRVAERVRRAIATTVLQYRGMTIAVTASLGVAQVQDEEERIEDLIQRADEALYLAKRQGRNRICLAGARARGTSGPAARAVM